MNGNFQSATETQNQGFDINTLGMIFNRPVYDLEQVLPCADSEVQQMNDLINRTSFLRLTSVAFRDRRDIRKALGQFYGVLHAMNVTFWYILEGDVEEGVIHLYLGIVGEPNSGKMQSADSLLEGDDLTSSLLGIMPGCQAEVVGAAKKRDIIAKLSQYENSALVTGVPTCLVSWDKREQYQEEEKARTGVERIIDSLGGSNFALSILCKPLDVAELREYRSCVAELHNIVKPLAKYQTTMSEAKTEGNTQSVNVTVTHGSSKTESQNTNQSVAQSEGTTEGSSDSWLNKDGNVLSRLLRTFGTVVVGGRVAEHTHSSQHGKSQNTTTTTGSSSGISIAVSDSESKSEGKSVSLSQTQTVGMNREVSNMELSALCEQLGKLHKRLINAEGNGMWKTCVMFHADSKFKLQRASYAGVSIWSGDDSAYDPMRCQLFEKTHKNHRSQDSLVGLNFTTKIDSHTVSVHPFGAPYSNLYTCLTHNELAHIADLPHWDVPGISVKPLVEYARNSPKPKAGVYSIMLGGLIDRTVNSKAHVDQMSPVKLGYDQLNKHCFVCGVTGSGKSTTMRRLLHEVATHREAPINFMVIEPVKTEYRALESIEKINLLRISPGRPGGAKFELNPFSFPEGVSLFTHLDFLKTAFNALLGAYSSMPFILEAVLCKAYEKKGWQLDTCENPDMEQELAATGRQSARWRVRERYMPCIKDMVGLVDDVITEFFGTDKSDYRISLCGALKARLSSLCSSHKGTLLNCVEQSQNFAELLKRNVLFELEAFADNEEKSFIMALLLTRIYEHRQVEYQNGSIPPNTLRHIVVLEEAHRLLAKTEGKGELQASPRSKAVEIFSDMLAEVRAYGQGMIIVDQIPSKLTPDVMKNTEVKISHRLLSKDDREAVGATMNLSKEQIEDLARHDAGEATMYFGNLFNAMHVKINELSL
ncbi:MAG: ATP-binding protein [Akkermansia sp.]|nr:ATP-binding protein [Akkermansia sp.]